MVVKMNAVWYDESGRPLHMEGSNMLEDRLDPPSCQRFIRSLQDGQDACYTHNEGETLSDDDDLTWDSLIPDKPNTNSMRQDLEPTTTSDAISVGGRPIASVGGTDRGFSGVKSTNIQESSDVQRSPSSPASESELSTVYSSCKSFWSVNSKQKQQHQQRWNILNRLSDRTRYILEECSKKKKTKSDHDIVNDKKELEGQVLHVDKYEFCRKWLENNDHVVGCDKFKPCKYEPIIIDAPSSQVEDNSEYIYIEDSISEQKPQINPNFQSKYLKSASQTSFKSNSVSSETSGDTSIFAYYEKSSFKTYLKIAFVDKEIDDIEGCVNCVEKSDELIQKYNHDAANENSQVWSQLNILNEVTTAENLFQPISSIDERPVDNIPEYGEDDSIDDMKDKHTPWLEEELMNCNTEDSVNGKNADFSNMPVPVPNTSYLDIIALEADDDMDAPKSLEESPCHDSDTFVKGRDSWRYVESDLTVHNIDSKSGQLHAEKANNLEHMQAVYPEERLELLRKAKSQLDWRVYAKNRRCVERRVPASHNVVGGELKPMSPWSTGHLDYTKRYPQQSGCTMNARTTYIPQHRHYLETGNYLETTPHFSPPMDYQMYGSGRYSVQPSHTVSTQNECFPHQPHLSMDTALYSQHPNFHLAATPYNSHRCFAGNDKNLPAALRQIETKVAYLTQVNQNRGLHSPAALKRPYHKADNKHFYPIKSLK